MYILIKTIIDVDGFSLYVDSLHGNILIDDIDYIRNAVTENMRETGFYYKFGDMVEEYVEELDFDYFLKNDDLFAMTTSSDSIDQRCYLIKIKEGYENDVAKVGILSSLNYNVITDRIKAELRDNFLNDLICTL